MLEKVDTTPAVDVPPLGRYQIDVENSTVTFNTRHMYGFSPVRGTFALRGGTINITEPLAKSSISAEIDAASFHTGNKQRDGNVRSKRLLDTAEFPLISFAGAVVADSALAGTLTVRGVTRPISVRIDGCTVAQRAFTATGSTRVDRTEFGLTAYRGLAARFLELRVTIHCVRK